MALTEKQRKELDGIVQGMLSSGKKDAEIRSAVEAYKKKNEPSALKKWGSTIAAGILGGPMAGVAAYKATSDPEKAKREASEGLGLLYGSTIKMAAKPFVSMRAGITGDFRPVNIPGAGAVRPYESPVSPVSTAIAKKNGFNLSQSGLKQTRDVGTSMLKEAAIDVPMSGLENLSFGSSSLVKKPLTRMAEGLYQSALKPSTTLAKEEVKNVVKTGLKERIWLTEGGVAKAAKKIDALEETIGKAIEEGKAAGKKISTKGLREFIDPIRGWFETIDVKASKAAQEYIDTTLKNFTKKYGKEIPIEEAQKLKVNTMRMLRSAYGELKNVEAETGKGVARFLKEGIAEAVPVVGETNARLKAMYQLDKVLEKSANRVGNLNLFGLGTKVLAGGSASPTVKAIGVLASILGRATNKSGIAIGLNELSKMSRAGTVPLSAILNRILERGTYEEGRPSLLDEAVVPPLEVQQKTPNQYRR